MGSNPADTEGQEASDASVSAVDIPGQKRIHAPEGDAADSEGSNRELRVSSTDVDRGFVPKIQGQGIASSWSASAEKQLFSSPRSSLDRVFPIRSVVGIDLSQTPHSFPERASERQDCFPGGTSPTSIGSSDPSSRQQTAASSSNSENDPSPRLARPRTEAQEKLEAQRRGRRQSSAQADPRSRGGTGMLLFTDTGSDNSNTTGTTGDVGSTGGGARGAGSVKSNSVGSNTPGNRNSMDTDSVYGLVTARFKHIVTAEGHAVITGRDGDTLQRCEDEPIHIPGAIQGFGLLIALREDAQGQLEVRVVSENSGRVIGYTPRELFQLKSFTDILSDDQRDNLLDHVDFIRDEDTDPAANGPEVFVISIRPQKSPRRSRKLWCAMHANPQQPDLIICEFELDDDQSHPLVPPNNVTPEPPEDTLSSEPTPEEYQDSTETLSKPLRVLRSARKRHGEAAAMEVFNIMSQVQEQLANASNLDQFLKILVGVVKELTGFHRVMIYQFDSSFNGRVVTELVDPRATKDLYKGLNFPASDIPKQARDLYKLNKVRMLYDRDLETARLVCRTIEDLEEPLDLSYSYLRAMSPIHIKYLANMAVRSSMSISINAFRELWGLIACHSYGSHGMRVSFPIRKMCRLVGDVASRNIERLSYASRLQARKLINTVPTQANPSGYIIASSDDLLKLFDADCGLLSIRGETKIMGKFPQSQEGLAMLEYLRMRKLTSVVTTQDIQADLPDLRYPPGFHFISGLLLVPLSVGGNDFIAFFRKGQVKEVKWAGNPYEKFVKEGTEGYLEPRKSFKTWSETVVGQCREWSEEQVETAAVLCLVYGKFIEVWRQKEAALQNSQLTRLLLANSAHEVRTPLNAIINYLEIALEGALDQETRDNLAKSHSASKSLIYVINDLLDLTNTEEGQELIKDEVFDLPATIREATEQFRGDAKRKDLEYEVSEQPGLPRYVQGDQTRVRQAVANITANAFQHTTKGSVTVEIYLQEINDRTVTVEIVVCDTGIGMSNDKLDALFSDLEQVSTDGDVLDNVVDKKETDKNDNRALGLGLAMVARIIRNMDGQLRLKSVEGEGSRFVIQLPFTLPDDDLALPEPDKNSHLSTASSARESKSRDGEVTLVTRSTPLQQEGVVTQRNKEEMISLSSFKSTSSTRSRDSTKSQVDRLIDAISGPICNSDDEDDAPSHRFSGRQAHARSAGSVGQISVPRSSDVPVQPTRAASYTAVDFAPRPMEPPAGSDYVQDSGTPLKAVKIPEGFSEKEDEVLCRSPSKVSFRLPKQQLENVKVKNADNLQVLVAEDDLVNSRIIKKRLEKAGHVTHLNVNGEECATSFGERPSFFDVVLMDMQMPVVGGLSATKMIRSFEKTHLPAKLSDRASGNGRIPIFAVSASLVERDKDIYITAGFDGWILKPIDFKRVNKLLHGIVDDEARNSCLYEPGKWEQGGWFQDRQSSPLDADTRPSPNPETQVGKSTPDAARLKSVSSGFSSQSSGESVLEKSRVSSTEGSTTPTEERMQELIWSEDGKYQGERGQGERGQGEGGQGEGCEEPSPCS